MDKLYRIKNNITGEVYVGYTSRTLAVRLDGHRGSAKRGSKSNLHRNFRKYGSENFTIEEIYRGKDALDKENDFIISENATLNMTEGGSANQLGRTWKWSEESCKNLSEGRKGMKFSDEHIRNMSLSQKGKPSPHKGTIKKPDSEKYITFYMREYRKGIRRGKK